MVETAVATSKVKIYLADWLYNAGVIGLIRILSENGELSEQKIIDIEENVISFERNSFENLADKFFKTGFEQYGRFQRIKETFLSIETKLQQIINKSVLTPEEELIIKNLADKYKNQIKFKMMDTKIKESDLEIPKSNELVKDPSLFLSIIQKNLKLMEDNFNDFFESDVKIYLSRIYGQKSFLNNSVKENLKQKFLEDFEIPLKENSNQEEKKLLCVSCGDRKAKKGINFDTGIAPFAGINKDSVNFVWDFNPKIPLCEICELVYFCAFAGFTDVSKGSEKVYYFVNMNSSVEELFNANYRLKMILKDKTIHENLLVEFFSDLILHEKKYTSDFVMSNLGLIELNLTNEVFPKIYSLNISKEKAKFFSDYADSLKKFSKLGYAVKDASKNILLEVIELILKNKLDYQYIYRLLKIYVSSKFSKNNLYKSWYNPHTLQLLTVTISIYFDNIHGRKLMNVNNKELWFVYGTGQKLAQKLKAIEQENKIPSIAYKLLNALRIGNVNLFMDVIFRTHMSLKMEEIPSTFIKALNHSDNFYALGYSFVNGLLGRNADDHNETKGEI